jgi:hypothetical protein
MRQSQSTVRKQLIDIIEQILQMGAKDIAALKNEAATLPLVLPNSMTIDEMERLTKVIGSLVDDVRRRRRAH